MELAPGLHSLGDKKGGRVRAFLLDNGGELTLIDTLYDTDGHLILDAIRQMGREITDLKHILITHGHRSHLGGLAVLKRLSNATVYAHEWEADIVAGERGAQTVTIIPGRPLFPWIKIYPFQFGLATGLGKHPPCPVDQWISEGDQIGPVQTLHMPGHSPGHLVFHWPEHRALFAGDGLATWPALCPGWPTFNLNPVQTTASLRRMADLEPDIVGVGHGDPIPADGRVQVRTLVDQGR